LLLASVQPLPGLQDKVNTGGLLDVAAAVSHPISLDADGDGIPDALDNCPWYASADTRDRDRDGIGDACTCGDENSDAIVDVRDLIALNEVIFLGRPPTPLCDANNDGVCDVVDAPRIWRRIFGGAAYCARYPRARP
jgi:hypothetical protein